MEQTRKQLVINAGKLKLELRDQIEAVKRAKLKYEKAAKDLELARNELASTKTTEADLQNTKIVRIEKRLISLETELQTMENGYKQQIQQSNVFLIEYQTNRWPAVLNEFEQFESTRIHFLKSNFVNFSGLMEEIPSVLSEVLVGKQAAEAIDAETDIQTFIKAHATQKDILPPFLFEQYQESSVRPSPRNLNLWGSFKNTISSQPPPQETAKPLPGVFGTSIVDLLEKQKEQFPDLEIPQILAVLSEGIVTLGGLFTEGIFRIAGSASGIQNMRKQLDKGDFTMTTRDVHVLAALLKQFLRDLPEPLICTPFYDDCISQVIRPLDIYDKLPPPHRDSLKYLIGFLQLFTSPEHLVCNKMDATNLATIFAPAIFRCPYNDPSILLASSPPERQFTTVLLKDTRPLDHSYFPFLVGNAGQSPPPPISVVQSLLQQEETPVVQETGVEVQSETSKEREPTPFSEELESFTDLGAASAEVNVTEENATLTPEKSENADASQ